jgi:hypothetical protein
MRRLRPMVVLEDSGKSCGLTLKKECFFGKTNPIISREHWVFEKNT